MHKTILYVVGAIARRTLILVACFVAFAWLLYLIHRLIY